MRKGPATPAEFEQALTEIYELTKTKGHTATTDLWTTASGKVVQVPHLPRGYKSYPYYVLEAVIEQLVALGELRPDPGPPDEKE